MDSATRTRLAANRGVASVAELEEVGLGRPAVSAMVRAGELIRVRRDAVVDATAWRAADPSGRHALRARAVLRSVDPDGTGPYALSHHSALAVHGLPVFGGDQRVHLVRTDGHRGRTAKNTHVHPPVDPDDVQRVDGVRLVRPAKAALQHAGVAGVEAGLVSADAALRLEVATTAELCAALVSGGFGAGVRRARLVAELADGRIESPGESRLRWALRLLGFLTLEPQVRILDGDGRVVARVDFLLEQRVVIEFDGRVKYDDPSELWQEKRREDRLRSMGYEVVRITWEDLAQPARIRALVMQARRRCAVASHRAG